MSEKCNGVKSHKSETKASQPKNGVRRFSIADASQESVAIKDVFLGFEKSPVVTLTRADISPYLKSMRQKYSEKFELQKCLSTLDLAVHSKRLGDNCSVSVLRYDLNDLKMAFQKDPNNPIFNATNIANLKCKICKKVYSSEKKLQKHQENKHMLVYKSNDKAQKRVSFSDQVIVHEVKEYHKCRKCTKIFEKYNLLKRHMKQRHKKHMLQHKWTHFLKTSDNSQLRPNIVKPKTDFQRFYKVDEVPDHMQPQVILERIKVGGKELTNFTDFVDVNCFDEYTGEIKKPVVDPVSKKTIISKHQCQTCGKYYSTNYCLNRHIVTQHSDYENLKCKVCEETFVWPSLLHNHKCIRLNLPEIPFDDARPEIHFDNLNEIQLDDLPITDDDYIHTVDFEIPAPVVELTEYNWGPSQNIQNCYSGCKIVMQEVPIEF